MVGRGLWGLAFAMALGGCVTGPVKQAEQRRPLTSASMMFPTAQMQPVGLARIISSIPRGTTIGGYSYGPGCDFGRTETWEADPTDLANAGFSVHFVEALSGAGYRVVGDPKRMFDVDEERAGARFLVGAEINDVQMSLCNHVNFWTMERYGPRGDAYMKVRWQVYSVAERRVVYEVSTEGNGRTESGSRSGLVVLMQRAFGNAARNLGADPKLRSILAGQETTVAQAKPAVAGGEAIEIPRFTGFRTAAAGRLTDLQQSAVTIVHPSGHGSGFFVSNDGLILTNSHVVGEAEAVNVRLLAGVEVTGKVLRRHAARDVALIKVDLVRTRPLPINLSPVKVGDDVYAVGAPADASLAGSVTRGIVSALRRETVGGVDMDMIQSDVVIHGGNSGGPLLDASGNVIGITVSGIMIGPQKRGVGTNFFIPIADALERLNIRLGESRTLQY